VFVDILSGSRIKSRELCSEDSMNSILPISPHDLGSGPLEGRVVVVSPHLDDAIISLGATIAWAVQAGARVEVLTVFADVPSSEAQASPWDRNCGFSTEGQAARARREEDRQACAVLGAEPRWLNFGDECYERRGSDHDIWAAVTSVTRGADCVCIPGFPLLNPDHAYLSELLLRKGLTCRQIVLYAEQPYVFAQKLKVGAAIVSPLNSLIGAEPPWQHLRTERAHRQAKRKAVRFYRSQIYHLGLRNIGLYRMLWREAAHGGETVAALSDIPNSIGGFERTAADGRSNYVSHAVRDMIALDFLPNRL
jgi:LmbE family N-acetylglucosaminyl deacetylase